MRYAIISDIHGNLHSLELVLDDIQKAKVDQIICLGDVSSLGPKPIEIISRLRDLEIPTIMGNHDDYLLDLTLTENHHPWLRAMEIWAAEKLSTEDKDFLRSFPPHLTFPLDDNTSMLCFHGSLRSNEEFLYPTATPELLDEIFEGQDAKVLVGGHTHVQMIRQHKHFTFLNPGSVGMPFEFPTRGPEPHALLRAEYAIVDMTDGKLAFDLRQLPIDFELFSATAIASGMPEVDLWLSTWDT
jgi:putative phosphoesterase